MDPRAHGGSCRSGIDSRIRAAEVGLIYGSGGTQGQADLKSAASIKHSKSSGSFTSAVLLA